MATTDAAQKGQDDHQWLIDALARHERLTPLAISLLQGVLGDRGIEYLSISGRTKDADSVLEKIRRKSYSDPEKQITDLTGIRVVTFFNSQVRSVCDLIREIFDVDDANSLDKAEALGSDRVGYRSFHFVCSLGSRRGSLPEYGSLCNLKFEVQVRTVLQHGWAEITHDRSYKFGQALPGEIQRKLNLYAGMLEVVDAGFDEVARDIDVYAANLNAASQSKLFEEPLNSISIDRLIKEITLRYSIRLPPSPDKNKEKVLSEAKNLGYMTVGEIWNILTDDFVSSYKEFRLGLSEAAFLRVLMVYADPDKYFANSEYSWRRMDQKHFDFLAQKLGRPKMEEVVRANNLLVGAERE